MLFDTILEGAVRVLEEHGLKEFTTRAIAERSGVSVGSVYQYFGSKDAIMSEIVLREHKRILSVLDAALNVCDTMSFTDATRFMIELGANNAPNRKLYRILEAEEERLPRTAELSEVEQAIIDRNRRFFGTYLRAKVSEDRIGIIALDIFKIIRALHDGPQPRVEADSPDALPNRIIRAVHGYIDQVCSKAQ